MCSHKLIFPQSLGKCINIHTNITLVYLRRCVTIINWTIFLGTN